MKTQLKNYAFLALVFSTFFISGCGHNDNPEPGSTLAEKGVPGCTNVLADGYDPDATINDGSCEPTDCSKCDFFISGSEFGFDGEKKGVKPGDIICLDATVTYGKPVFLSNLEGTKENPIIIVNCGGKVTINLPGSTYAMKTDNCKFFRITGTGSNDHSYGIELSGTNSLGISLDHLSTNFEVDHLEVHDIGFAGIMAKTDPNCDAATQRGNFTMRDISIHDNYVHDTDGEGLYIGNSFFANGVNNDDCGTLLPHEIKGVNIYNNKVINSGWEAIQLGSAVEGAKVHDNHIENYGTANKTSQKNGIQIGEGTGGLCYNNYINSGPGNGIIVLGLGDNIVFNNLIINTGSHGVFCDERYTPGDGFSFINNTIINPAEDGIRIYAELVAMNHIINNIIINPGSYSTYAGRTTRTGDDAFVYKLNDNVKIEMKNNCFTLNIDTLKFKNGDNHFSLSDNSPLIDAGADVSDFGVTFDFEGSERPSGNGYDPGAMEHH